MIPRRFLLKMPLEPLSPRRSARRERGAAFVSVFILLGAIALGAGAYMNRATQTLRDSRRRSAEIQTTHLCEAGVQSMLRSIWRPFKTSQNFVNIDTGLANASTSSPKGTLVGALPGVGRFSTGVIKVLAPKTDTYSRIVTIRSVGYIDRNDNGAYDAGEAAKIVDVVAQFQLARSQVFDYQYFVNNYGWMNGFGTNDLIVNGDMRANGNFDFTNGVPTVNGTIIAALNEKLSPVSPGKLNGLPVKWTNSAYNSATGGGTAEDDKYRWRQAYDPTKHGARGSTEYDKWREIIFDSDASIQNNRLAGAAIGDVSGLKGWQRTSSGSAGTTTTLDTSPTQEVVMPDLSDLSTYQDLSNDYVDDKMTYSDGTANPYGNQGAWIEIWDSAKNKYQRISNNGVISGSTILIGTATKPIKIHGPVTVTQDVLIKGSVQGQGTIYAGRNVHIVGSIRYVNKPDFRGNDPTAIDNGNEKDDMLGLAARGSVIMGNTATFTDSSPLQYMTPPFTKGRYDEAGNWIPPYNAKAVDSTGFMKYQTVLGTSVMNSVAEGINQIDAVLYTNFVGGGNVATGGGGITFNGSIISKDEAMVCQSLPMRCNYDSRIRERTVTQKPLIDIKLPRSPVMLRSTWQDRGFSWGS